MQHYAISQPHLLQMITNPTQTFIYSKGKWQKKSLDPLLLSSPNNEATMHWRTNCNNLRRNIFYFALEISVKALTVSLQYLTNVGGKYSLLLTQTCERAMPSYTAKRNQRKIRLHF